MKKATNFFKQYGAEAEQNGLLRLSGDHYVLFWGFGTDGDLGNYNWRKGYDHKPTASEIREDIETLIDSTVENKILTGMEYEGTKVYLSVENQLNFLMAVVSNIKVFGSIDVTIRIGSADNPVYKTFTSFTKLLSFFTSVVQHVQACRSEGWSLKDGIDYSDFEEKAEGTETETETQEQ